MDLISASAGKPTVQLQEYDWKLGKQIDITNRISTDKSSSSFQLERTDTVPVDHIFKVISK